jgi:hypothetical protein
MHRPRKCAGGGSHATLLLAAAICLPRLVSAQTTSWTNAAGDGSWSDAGNWTNGVPGTGSTAYLTSTLGATQIITYNYAGPTVTLAEVNVNLTGIVSGTPSEVLAISGNTLTSVNVAVGGYLGSTLLGVGVGTVNQSGGLVQVGSSGDFVIGVNVGDHGYYNLSGGTISDPREAFIGYMGTGIFNQSGGANIGGSELQMLVGSAGTGTYILSGGSLSYPGEFVGSVAGGYFNQTGGTNTLSLLNALVIGNQAGTTGTYTLSGTGTISSAGREYIGDSGVGCYVQTGGTNTTKSAIEIGVAPAATGSFTLTGGTVTGTSCFVGGNGNPNSGGDATLTVGGTGVLNIAGTLMVYNTTVGASLNLTGGTINVGTLNLSGIPSLLNWTDGTLNFTNSFTIGTGASLGSNVSLVAGQTLGVTGKGNVLTVAASGTLNLNGGTANLSGLSIASGGTVNVSSPLFIDYGVGNPSPASAIQSYLQSGYNGGQWNGPYMNSVAVSGANASQSKLVYDVGYADGSDGLTSVPSGEIEIMPTLAGDAKLQGTVDFGDFQLLAQYFGQPGSWDEGNFTYGSTVDFGDFQVLAQNFGASSSGLTGGEFSSLNQFAARFGDGLAANPDGVEFQVISVPEPASAAAIFLAGSALLRQRRRKKLE